MAKIYKVLGKRGRVTIPHEIRCRVGFAYNDVLSFSESEDGRTVVVRREKICDGCSDTGSKTDNGVTLLDFLNGLTDEEQRAALVHLSVKWAEKQGGGKYRFTRIPEPRLSETAISSCGGKAMRKISGVRKLFGNQSATITAITGWLMTRQSR